MSETTNLVALRARRQRAIALISERYAEGLLDDDEVDRRLGLAEQATHIAALDALTVDLEAPPEAMATAWGAAGAGLPVPSPSPETALVVPASLPAERQITSILASNKLRGAWTPARETRVLTILGNTTLDLREAYLPRGELEVRVTVVLGDVIVILRPGVRLTTECTPILGDVKRDTEPAPPNPEGPHVRISGVIVLGDLKIRFQRPGESWRETKKERKRLAKARRKALKAGRRS